MLYVTTRDKFDTYTEHFAGQSDRGPDGGLYLPFRFVKFDRAELLSLMDQTYGQRIATVLNGFFSGQITGWDVELCAGKSPVKLMALPNRVALAECWHNHDLDFTYLENSLCARVCSDLGDRKPTSWMRIAVRIAVLFAIYGELLAMQTITLDQLIDVSVAAGDFTAPMAAWYAREMGLPIGNVVCSHENSSVWDLIHHGELRTDLQLPENLERLVSATLGVEENLRFCDTCEQGRLYATRPGDLEILRKGMYASVVSAERMTALVLSVYRTTGYILDAQTAAAYGGLQDYRAKTGEARVALLLSERSPVHSSAAIAEVLQIPEQDLLRQLGE